MPALLAAAALPPEAARAAQACARQLVLAIRQKKRHGGVDGLVQEYALSSQEGVALMCLAEALLRIPDTPTRDALIRDKIAEGDWRAHAGHSPSLFVNAATWGLVVTGKLTASANETSLASALTRLIARGGEPLIRSGVNMAMRMMGEQFVLGQTIDEALARSRRMQARGFRHSFDMLGEAATTAEDASRYLAEYHAAIAAIGAAATGAGVLDRPGISVKLSALHPRYSRAKRDRVMTELLPRLTRLAHAAHAGGIGLNIDAEEADRLDLSLDLLEALCRDPVLAGWDGIGFVVQAYQKRAPFVLDWVIGLARQTGHRIMLRLVKGAYWDTEIKRAQVDGLDGYPVFTRKAHTDVSYLACARTLLDAPDAVFPQFATHNAHTLAAILSMAPGPFVPGQYEFQCLHGMGEPLYEEVVGPGKLGRPCRIYAPVGSHQTLLAYLVRRLLENGANSSFVNRLGDPNVPVDDLVADPVASVLACQPVGAPHPAIPLPRDLFGPSRRNSSGPDLTDEPTLAALAGALRASADVAWTAAPAGSRRDMPPRRVLNPANAQDEVGTVWDASPADVADALSRAVVAAPDWAAAGPAHRAARLALAADLVQADAPTLMGLLVREAGKTLASAAAEVREAVDFLRYYGAEAVHTLDADSRPLGPVACISPWNFPLAIFTGQAAAALAAGNVVLAKPAEETPLAAARAAALLHEAGIPPGALQVLPGDGSAGAALVGDRRVQGVLFTGSTAVARLIQQRLADRLGPEGRPIPLVAETGGQNAMIVDSSALAEQVVADVIASAFDSAGQRCSALRVLCLQEDIADRTLAMLKGAVRELQVGAPDRLEVDVGPVISAIALTGLREHVEAMRARGFAVTAEPLPAAAGMGTFFAPTLIEIGSICDLDREVFGPVLHVVRFRRDGIDALMDAVNATGYGLTFGLHTRIDETVARVLDRIGAGNAYVNRNTIGAVVGVQPFGGGGLSGTGPKAGGPLYLHRLTATEGGRPRNGPGAGGAAGQRFAAWLEGKGHADAALRCRAYLAGSPLGSAIELPGPTGEQNVYELRPRGRFAAVSHTAGALFDQAAALFATGNTVLVERSHPGLPEWADLPADLSALVRVTDDWLGVQDLCGVLFDGTGGELLRLNRQLAFLPGPILAVHCPVKSGGAYCLDWLLQERTISTNTAAAGGNASLMTLA